MLLYQEKSNFCKQYKTSVRKFEKLACMGMAHFCKFQEITSTCIKSKEKYINPLIIILSRKSELKTYLGQSMRIEKIRSQRKKQ